MAACAASPDLRGSTALTSAEPQVLVAGPARLLHVNAVNADRRKGFTLYRVRGEQGARGDCRSARKDALLEWNQESDLLVRKDETICVASEGRTQLSWHALPATGDVGETHASLDQN
jgi:hypothetical protein